MSKNVESLRRAAQSAIYRMADRHRGSTVTEKGCWFVLTTLDGRVYRMGWESVDA